MYPGCWLGKTGILRAAKSKTHHPCSRRSAPVRCSMSVSLHRLLGLCLCVAVLGLPAGCKSSEQMEEQSSSAPAQPSTQPDLAALSETVRTIQLYRGDDERRLPVVSIDNGTALTLEFDLMEEQGRPLSVYFQHADRTWRRDLQPSQALESFQNDRLVDYRSSRGTDVSYVHYQYRFPNDDIRFRVSGNYILRVTERGRRDSVLFERPFFVTEKQGNLQLGAESLPIPGQQRPMIQPRVRFTPPSEIRGDSFGHAVCFVRNGRLADTRCVDRPLLARQPELEFELERERAYAPATVEHRIDLSELRSRTQIARVERTNSPIQAVLDPDYARFDESTLKGDLNGQTIVRSALTSRVDPVLSAEYVETTFTFVPSDKRPYTSPPVVAGSFSGMDPARGTRMEWNAVQGQYEGTVLLKQGIYPYFYSTSDPALAREIRGTQRRFTSTYMAFVYYRDARLNTDRLLQVNGFAP